MTPCGKQMALTLAAIVVVATPISMVNAVTDKSEIPAPEVLSKGTPAAASSGISKDSDSRRTATNKTATEALYWYDGKRKRMLILDTTTLADFGPDPQSPAAQPKLIEQAGGTLAKRKPDIGVSPMFKDSVSGQTAGALPGSIMVKTLRPLDAESIDSLARAFGTRVIRPIGSPTTATNDSYDFWLFEAPAGMPTLELANRIHESGQVSSAAPNWWKPRERK